MQEDEVEGEAGLAEGRRAVASAGKAAGKAAGMLADIGGSAAAAVDGVVAEAEAEADAALETATTRDGEDAYRHGSDDHTGQAAAGDDVSRSCASSCSGCREEDEDGSDDTSTGSSSEFSDSGDDGAEAAYAAALARARAAANFGHTFGVPLPVPTSAAAAVASDAGGDGDEDGRLFDEDGAPLPPAPAPAPARPAVRFLSAREDMPPMSAGAGAHLHPPAAGIVDLSLQLEEVRHAIALEETYAANGNPAAAARLRELRGRQAKLAAHCDRRGMEAAWAARGYSCGDVAEGKHVRRASEMALRDACRQFMLRRPMPGAGAGAASGARGGFGFGAAYHCSEA